MRLRGGSKEETEDLASMPFSKLEGRVYEDLDRRRSGKRMRFDLPIFSIKTSHINLTALNIVDSYTVGPSTIYITEDYEYLIHDPPLTPEERSKLMDIASKLLFLMPISIVNDERKFDEYLAKAGLKDGRFNHFLKREILGYGPLEPLVMDPRVEDIVVASSSNPVSCMHSDYGTMPTNVLFTPEETDRYVEKLVHLSGKSVSLYRPLLSIRLPNGGRLSASYKREVSPEGSNFIIRKFPEKPWSITSLMLLNTIPPEMAAWLMLLEEHRKAFLVCGAMGTGKTSLINALCNLIPERSVIVTIEDTPELRLVHPNRFSLVVRESATLDDKGEIGMFALVKEALRMSADYIIVGEVRGEEGRIWAQAIMTGHGGITSLHAESPQAALERLLSPPISVERSALKFLSGIVSVGKLVLRTKGKLVQRRRALNFYDLGDNLELAPLFDYNYEADSFSYNEESIIASNTARRIMTESGLSEDALLEKYLQRMEFLRRLGETSRLRPEFREYSAVTKAVWAFQSCPEGFDPESAVIAGDGALRSRERLAEEICNGREPRYPIPLPILRRLRHDGQDPAAEPENIRGWQRKRSD